VSALEYELHGVRLAVEAPEGAARDAIASRLARCRVTTPAAADVTVRIGSEPVERPAGEGRPVYPWEPGEVSWFDDAGVLYMTVGGDVRLAATPASGLVEAWASDAALRDAWLFARPLLTLPLVEMLKWKGLYSVHAAGAATDGRAILLVGPSGCGKSTLSLALARHGLDHMGDDMLFATHRDAEVRLHAFPEEADVSPSSAAWFDELAAFTGPAPDGWPKHRVRVDDAFGVRVAPSATPAALVFPAIAESGQTTVEPLAPADALVELAPNVLLTDAAMAQRHLEVLGELARSAPAYRLAAGRDIAHAASVLAELVSSRS
jgi:hypothetical protein